MPFCVIKSRSIKFALIVILVSILLSVSIDGVNAAQVYFGYPAKNVPIYCVETSKPKVAISFDAAWGAEKTENIMTILKEFNSNATFFLVGFWVDKYPELVKKIDENGFEIGTHSNTHPDFTKLSESQMRQELETSVAMIKKITNKNVELFRPPYGAYNNSVINVSQSLNLKPIQWDVDSLDWKGISAKEITERVLSKVKNGSIILCHNDSKNILDALPLVLDRLIKKGYEITNIGDLVYKNNYVIDRNGTQRPKNA
ncbi:MAG: polysaccharide deacetylase family protein [Clostridia bacterium]